MSDIIKRSKGKLFDRSVGPVLKTIKEVLKPKLQRLVADICEDNPIDKNNIVTLNLEIVARICGYKNVQSARGHILAMRKARFLVKAKGRDKFMINPMAIMYGDSAHQAALIRNWCFLQQSDKYSNSAVDIPYDRLARTGYTNKGFKEVNKMLTDVDTDMKNSFNNIEQKHTKELEAKDALIAELLAQVAALTEDKQELRETHKESKMDLLKKVSEMQEEIRRNHAESKEAMLFLLSKFEPEQREELKTKLRLVVDNEV